MSVMTTADGTQLYYTDWGNGDPIVFCHGWPLNAGMWEYQMMALAGQGYRCIAHDRRGFGRSSSTWNGYDYDVFADDLAALIEGLDLSGVVLVGFAMGGGEVARYVSRHGTQRLLKTVLMSAVTPLLVRTQFYPQGVEPAVFDAIRAGLLADRAQFFADFGPVLYGPGASQGMLDWSFALAMQTSIKASHDCVTAFSATDFRLDLQAFDVPTLVIHGEDDQLAPVALTGNASARAIPGAELLIYPGAPHGLFLTHKGQVNADLLRFIRA